MEKTCKVCGVTKAFVPDQQARSKASGFHGSTCWACFVVKQRAYYATPKGKATQQAYYNTPAGRARHNAAAAKTRSAEGSRTKATAAVIRYYATPEGRAKHIATSLAWQKKYPEKATAKAVKRHTAKLQRVPAWADLDAIAQVYAIAAQQGLSVDHIYPLRGALVSGLHVENNLQLLTKSENSKKGNKMPNLGEIA